MMKRFVVVASVAVSAFASAPLTVEDYATMPSISAPQFSPDGKRIAYVVTQADLGRSAYNSDIWIINADGTGNRQLTRAAGTDNDPQWSPDGKRIAFVSDRDGRASIYLISPDGGEAEQLVDVPTRVEDFEWSPDGSRIAFLRSDESSAEEQRRVREKDDARILGESTRRAHLHVVDVATRTPRRLTTGDFSIFNISWSPDGKTIAFDRAAGPGLDQLYHTDIYVISSDGGEPRPLVVRTGMDRIPKFSPDGRSIAFTSWGGEHDWLLEQQLYVTDIEGKGARKVSGAYDRTLESSFLWSPDSRFLWFEGPMNTTNQLFRVNVDGTAFRNVTNVQGLVDDVDIDFASDRMAFVYQDLDSPPELYVSPLKSFAPRPLTDHNAAFRDRAIGKTEVIRWKNPQDGREIEGLLTLPVGYTAGKRYPLLTFVHGGPASRFDQGFLGYLGYIYPPQVFAARGFAVLRPNPRGTGGYGGDFRAANRNDWGGMDWVDINAGIDSLISRGVADPQRLGLMGWSYGGYIASWAIGHGGERFDAISIGAPLVDLLSFHGTADIRDFIPSYFRPGGARFTLDQLRERSPLWHLRKIDTPVLIQHGEADDRVPLSQGVMLYRMLQEMGVNVTMVVYPRTPHTPREPKLRVDSARRNIEFFEKHVR
jgi:dipeptidyl aminopeptidase/acylaminoacyl peptidase